MRPFPGCESLEALKIIRDRSSFLLLCARGILSSKRKEENKIIREQSTKASNDIARDTLGFGFINDDHKTGTFWRIGKKNYNFYPTRAACQRITFCQSFSSAESNFVSKKSPSRRENVEVDQKSSSVLAIFSHVEKRRDLRLLLCLFQNGERIFIGAPGSWYWQGETLHSQNYRS